MGQHKAVSRFDETDIQVVDFDEVDMHEIALIAGADVRSVRKELKQKGAVRGMAGARIRRAAKSLRDLALT